ERCLEFQRETLLVVRQNVNEASPVSGIEPVKRPQFANTERAALQLLILPVHLLGGIRTGENEGADGFIQQRLHVVCCLEDDLLVLRLKHMLELVQNDEFHTLLTQVVLHAIRFGGGGSPKRDGFGDFKCTHDVLSEHAELAVTRNLHVQDRTNKAAVLPVRRVLGSELLQQRRLTASRGAGKQHAACRRTGCSSGIAENEQTLKCPANLLDAWIRNKTVAKGLNLLER